MRRRLPAGVRMYTGDDFNYAELIAGDEQGYSRRAARHLRRDRAGGLARRWRRSPRGDRARFHAILAPTVPLSRHIFAAPTRFYKTGVVFLAWLNGHQDHFTMVGGQQSARSPAASRRAVPAGRRGRPAARSRARRRAHEARCWRVHGVALTDARLRADHRWLSINTATVRAAVATLPRDHRGLRAARHPRASRPGATRSPRPASTRPRARIHDAGLAALGLLPRRHVPRRRRAGAARRVDDNRRAVDEAAALGAPCLVLVVGGLPRSRWPGRAVARTSPARAQMVRDGIAELLDYARARRHAAGDRAAASDVRRRPRLREHAGAGARHLRRSSIPAATARSASRSTSITSGGIPSCTPADRARRPRQRLLAYHVCDWLVPTTRPAERPRHDGRRRHRPAPHPAGRRGRRLRRLHEVEIFSDHWWARPIDEVLATCIERYRTVV